MSEIIKNAIIERATLGTEDHGVLISYLTLDCGDFHQGFGGWVLHGAKGSAAANYAGEWLMRILEVAGVEDWSRLVGCPVRIRRKSELNEPIIAIGHILKDVWFEPAVVFDRMKKEAA